MNFFFFFFRGKPPDDAEFVNKWPVAVFSSVTWIQGQWVWNERETPFFGEVARSLLELNTCMRDYVRPSAPQSTECSWISRNMYIKYSALDLFCILCQSFLILIIRPLIVTPLDVWGWNLGKVWQLPASHSRLFTPEETVLWTRCEGHQVATWPGLDALKKIKSRSSARIRSLIPPSSIP
jgi:hypothetical protein